MNKGKREAPGGRRWPVWLRHVTEFMFVCMMALCCLVVVNACAIAWYSTVVLEQPYPLESMAEQAFLAGLGAIAAKVVGNAFEHNDGGIFGHSNSGDENGV